MRRDESNFSIWVILGPLFVIIGAGFWGIETLFRVNLNTRFDSDVLVFHEHLFCILFALPYFLIAFPALRREIKDVPRSAWIYLVLSGVIGSAIGTIFFTLSLKTLNPSVANVLLNFQPIVTVAFATLLLKEKFSRVFFLWAAIAIACGSIIASDEFKFPGIQANIGLVFIALTAISWGFATVAGRGAMLHIPLATAILGRFIIGAVAVAVMLMVRGKFNSTYLTWESLSEPFVLKNYLWLSFAAGVVPLYFYFKGMSKTAASVGGFCELTQTFSALVVTWGIMQKPLSFEQIIAGAILLVCVYMINRDFAKSNKLVA